MEICFGVTNPYQTHRRTLKERPTQFLRSRTVALVTQYYFDISPSSSHVSWDLALISHIHASNRFTQCLIYPLSSSFGYSNRYCKNGLQKNSASTAVGLLGNTVLALLACPVFVNTLHIYLVLTILTKCIYNGVNEQNRQDKIPIPVIASEMGPKGSH